jgi:hypothetical protein
MIGKKAFGNIGKQLDKQRESIQKGLGSAFQSDSKKKKRQFLLGVVGEKINQVFVAVDNALETHELKNLEKIINKYFKLLEKKITAQCNALNKINKPNTLGYLNVKIWAEQLSSMNDYLKNYPNTSWFSVEQKNKRF